MRFEVDEEATALRDAAGAILDGKATPDIVRAGWPGGEYERVRVIWRKLADSGAVGALVPPTSGGLGLDANCLVPLLERIGRSGLPVPAVETIAVAAPLMAEVGYPQLPAVLAGELLVTAQLGGGDLVPFGQHADLVLLRKGNSIRIHQRADLVLEPVVTIDGSRALARLVVTPGDGIVVADGLDSVERAWRAGVLGTSALLIGLADRLLDMTVGYVKEREQFGSPIGSFQAIKHALTSALLALEFARPAALAAGWAQATNSEDVDQQTSMAKVLASNSARLIARTAIQCHGAIAYTTEYDLHLFAKRVWALAPSWGDNASHHARLATALGLTEG